MFSGINSDLLPVHHFSFPFVTAGNKIKLCHLLGSTIHFSFLKQVTIAFWHCMSLKLQHIKHHVLKLFLLVRAQNYTVHKKIHLW